MKTWKELRTLFDAAVSTGGDHFSENTEWDAWRAAVAEVNDAVCHAIDFLPSDGSFRERSDHWDEISLNDIRKIRDALIALDLGPVEEKR